MSTAIYKLPIKDTIVSAWRKINGIKTSFWGGTGLIFLTSVFVSLILMATLKGERAQSIINLMINFFGGVFGLGFIYMSIRRVKDLSVSLGQVFVGFRLHILFNYIGAMLFIGACVSIAFLGAVGLPMMLVKSALISKWIFVFCAALFVLILLYFLVRLEMAWPIIVDKELNFWKAILLSWRMTKGNFWRLLALWMVGSFALCIGVLALLVGSIWTAPFFYVLVAEQYQRLLANNQ